MGDVRQALAGDGPLDLLGLVSSLLAPVDPRSASPFEREPRPDVPSQEEIIRSFLEIALPETSALLAVIAGLLDDELLGARIARELSARRDALPAWTAGMTDLAAYRAVEMVHVLGDGDNVMVGARLPTGEQLTAVVYIDHNMGTVVKDAFAVGEPIAVLVEHMQRAASDPDISWRELDLADARARITDAIATGAITFPPFETDTWPSCRPLVEWIARSLPVGGTGYQRPEWDDSATRTLVDRFLRSPFAAGFDDEDHRGLLDSLIWFGSDYGPGDPLRWSPTSVEILLTDWLPRKIVADAAYLAKAPELLRAFIRFCHHERDIRASLTADTLRAVGDYEVEYQRAIRTPRPQGPMALLAAMGAIDSDEPWPIPDDEPSAVEEIMLGRLRRAVGGDDALHRLDDRPLPDEPFDWTAITSDIRQQVAKVLALCDGCCHDLLDVEHRTAARRLLARVARGDPQVFRRSARFDHLERV